MSESSLRLRARAFAASISLLSASVLALAALEARGAEVAIPARIPLQGFLTDSGGTPINGPVTVTLRLYDVPSGGTALFTESQTVNAVSGVFNAMLGDVTPLDSALFKSTPVYYVGVDFDGDELTPRLRFGSVPYAVHAADGVPTGAVMTFDLAACPPGWTEYVAARGRSVVGLPAGGTLGGTVGTPYANVEARSHAHAATASSDGSHTHSVDPAAVTSSSVSVPHTHAVDPLAVNTTSHAHGHVWAGWANGNVPVWTTYDSNGDPKVIIQWTDGMDSAGAGNYPLSKGPVTQFETMHTSNETHSHGVDIPSTTSGAASATAHAHSVDVSAATSSASGSHSHLLTVGSTFAGTPYVQLLTCRKE